MVVWRRNRDSNAQGHVVGIMILVINNQQLTVLTNT